MNTPTEGRKGYTTWDDHEALRKEVKHDIKELKDDVNSQLKDIKELILENRDRNSALDMSEIGRAITGAVTSAVGNLENKLSNRSSSDDIEHLSSDIGDLKNAINSLKTDNNWSSAIKAVGETAGRGGGFGLAAIGVGLSIIGAAFIIYMLK